MSAIALLMGLLVLTYIGSLLLEGRTVRGFGLPSGVEWLVVGVLLGPEVLGVVSDSLIEVVAPIVLAVLGWLAFVDGLRWGRVGYRTVSPRRALVSMAWSVLTGGAAGVAVYFALPRIFPSLLPHREILSIVLGTTAAETARAAVRWARERHGARGPLWSLLADISHSEDVAPLLALAWVFASQPPPGTAALSAVGRMGITLGLGIALGGMATALLGREFRVRETWGTLFGAVLFGAGIAIRLQLSVLTVTFLMGLVIRVLSHHAGEIRALVAPTERPLQLPVLLLAGIGVQTDRPLRVLALIIVVLVARTVAELVAGWVLATLSQHARRGGPLLGLGLLSSGGLSVWIALGVSIRFPGEVGDTVLAVVAGLAVFGEMFGPPALRAALARAGEVARTPSVSKAAVAKEATP